ncbi:hypothetical protein [Asticcacaulis sp. W401b]|uniref:hypothetical protein n=1 Tax=Asticcacaulis sp. W401b TaxID=3388666 RepID=UPI003970C1BD
MTLKDWFRKLGLLATIALSVSVGAGCSSVPKAEEVGELAYIFYSDKVCQPIPDVKGERIADYAIRRTQTYPSELGYIDADCLVTRYGRDVQADAAEGVSVAQYIEAYRALKANPRSYCENSAIYNNLLEITEFSGLNIYRDYTPEFYLLIARINQRYCKDFDTAYKYFLLAEKSGAPFRVTEKFHRY